MKRIVTIFAALLLCAGLGAQSPSNLFRGRFPVAPHYKFNGTFFWDTKDYAPADVYYNGKLYTDVMLNIDAYKQELWVVPENAAVQVIPNRDQVAWLRWRDQLYVNLRYQGYADAPEGFFAVLQDGSAPLLMQVRKPFLASTSEQNGRGIGYWDPEYDYSVINYFSREEFYYTIREGKVQPLKRRERKRMLKLGGPTDSGLIHSRLSLWNPGPESTGTLSHTPQKQSGIGLPDGYFKPVDPDSVKVEYVQDAQLASYKNKTYIIGEAAEGRSKGTVQGWVTDLESGDPLSGVLVYDDLTKTYVRTNAKGRYSISLPAKENVLHFSYETKETLDLRVDVRGDGNLDVALPEQVTMLKEAVISAYSVENHRTTAMGIEKVSIQTMNKIPSAFGEGDLLKAVLTLPGVKSVGEASGGFNVRGGSADENMILFNENTIYNPSHLFGIFSSFNPDVVDNVELFKSSIPAEYGGRLSSVMRVSSKEGDLSRLHGSLGIGVLTSRAQIEGPLWKNRTTFVLGGRTTYSDWILKRLPSSSYYAGAQAGFWDVNAGLTHRFTQKDALQLSFYTASDRFVLTDKVTNSYSNLNGSLIYRHRGSGDEASWRIAAGYDRYTNLTGDHSWSYAAYDLETRINQFFAKGSWKKPVGRHTLSAGVHALAYLMEPGILTPAYTGAFAGDYTSEVYSGIKGRSLPRETALEPSLFVSDNFNWTDHFSVEGGLRLSSFFYKGGSPYLAPEFRLSAKYSPTDVFSIKGGFNTMQQYIHLVSNTSGISPLDTWKLSDADILPSTGWQGSLGAYWTWVNTGLDISAEVYWKQAYNALDFKPGATLSMNEHLAEDLFPVRSQAYGVELMIRRTTGKLTGWASYSYSRARYREMLDRGFETIAGGGWYNAPFDKPHEVKMVLNWALTHRFSFSANLDYSTGRPVTVPTGYYYYRGAMRMAYSERNSHRIPDYFRVDLAFNIDPGHYLKAIAHSSITIGVYNVLGRKNPYSVYFQMGPDGSVQGYMLSVFATQIPYINLNILF